MSTVVTTVSRKRKANGNGSSKAKRARPSGRMFMARRVVNVGKGPCPQKTIVWLKYCDQWNAPGTIVSDRQWRLNSIFDPDFALGGHQPLGRDQYAAFYNRYRVLRVKMELHVSGDATVAGGQTPWLCTVVPDNSASPYTTSQLAAEQSHASQHSVHQGSGNGGMKIVRFFDLAKITGVSNKEYADDRFQALFTADPSEVINLHVVTSNISGGAPAISTVQHTILLSYQVEMFDPLQMGGS